MVINKINMEAGMLEGRIMVAKDSNSNNKIMEITAEEVEARGEMDIKGINKMGINKTKILTNKTNINELFDCIINIYIFNLEVIYR
jgi:hypothetical protein